MGSSKFKIGLTSTAVAISFAGFAYVIFKRKQHVRVAEDALNYLQIKTVVTEEECDEVVAELLRRSKVNQALGFDCEWVTVHGKRKPVALVQLSSFDGYCGLFRLNMLETVPKSLKTLLEDEKVFKVGVAPADDGRYLMLDYSVDMKSTLDLRHIAVVCGYSEMGLASLTKALLGIVLDKSWRIRCSDWELEKLTDKQTRYAAADAHVAIKTLIQLVKEYNNSTLSWRKRLMGSTLEEQSSMNDLCRNYADIRYKITSTAKVKDDKHKHKEKDNKKEAVISKRYPHATRSKPLYHNCFLEAPDGELLCTCDNKKALWYIDKGLATQVKGDPLTVRLKFEPAGRSVGDVGKYYQLTKENKCVVCGATNSYIRKNVVPREYRKYFPEIMKDHSSHDVVLLCSACHQRSNMRDRMVRERLAAQCDAPLAHHTNNKYNEDQLCRKIRSAARALLYQSQKHALPESRRRQLEDVLLQHYPEHEELTQELLEEAAEIQVVYENADYSSHGQKVAEWFVRGEGGLLRLEEEWRQHFLSAMRPQHMPPLWSVTHNEQRLRVRLNEGRLSKEDLKLIGLTKWI